MSTDTITYEVPAEHKEAFEAVLSLLTTPDAPSVEPTERRNAAGRLVDERGRFLPEPKKTTAKKVTAKKAPSKAKTVQVEVTRGKEPKVTRQSIKVLRELGVTATGKRSLEVVERRAKAADITIEPVPYGTLS